MLSGGEALEATRCVTHLRCYAPQRSAWVPSLIGNSIPLFSDVAFDEIAIGDMLVIFPHESPQWTAP